jgi:hypothetical protein
MINENFFGSYNGTVAFFVRFVLNTANQMIKNPHSITALEVRLKPDLEVTGVIVRVLGDGSLLTSLPGQLITLVFTLLTIKIYYSNIQ